MFIPPGCVLLTAAADRLAEARRTAGQTSDDGQNAARAELRAEFYNGSISAMVISPSSGDAFVILQQHWALEKALTWLEQGECLLDGDFVYPYKPELAGPGRWPRMGKGERATIFVSEHDLQRLTAKQEVKQEAAPRLDVKELCPKSPPLSGESLDHVEEPEPEQARPAEPELLEKKARPAAESHQSKRAKRYIQKHFPDGTDGVSTPAIHKKLAKDKDLQAELEKEDGAGRAFSDCDQSRARPAQKVTRPRFLGMPGHAQRCPNSSRS